MMIDYEIPSWYKTHQILAPENVLYNIYMLRAYILDFTVSSGLQKGLQDKIH